MERKIGEIFEHNGDWYQCVGGTCRNCIFYYDTVCKNITTIGSTNFGNCHCSLRTDHKSVIFKKLEKVGEPYISSRNKKRYQLYRFFCLPITKDMRIEIGGTNCVGIEIKQNKENMEEKKDNYDGYMDKECIHICDALNSIPNVQTTESCCGHCRDRFMVFFTCDNPHSLAIIARVFDRRYISTSQPWYIELQTKDSGDYDYFIHSETKYDSEITMMKDVNQIIENIKHWCDDKFASHFKGCDDKPTLAPFDINLAKQGKPVCTRDGRKARIICFDTKGDVCPIIALVEKNGIESAYHYDKNGKNAYKKSEIDLMMFPEKKEGWVIIRKGNIYETEELARKALINSRTAITIKKITWEE
nr:MAG TPA: methyltransferase-like protein [Caudoviricetes sp.]